MSLSIKNEETHRLVRELADLTGESQTTAIATAVRERLERLRTLCEGGLADRLIGIGEDAARRLPEKIRMAEPEARAADIPPV